jgi:hypothetical protein
MRALCLCSCTNEQSGEYLHLVKSGKGADVKNEIMEHLLVPAGILERNEEFFYQSLKVTRLKLPFIRPFPALNQLKINDR